MVWPPQDTGIFAFKAACCCNNIAVAVACRSKTQASLDISCGNLPNPYATSYSFDYLGYLFDVAFTITGVDQCNEWSGSSSGYGTFLYTISGLTVTSSDPRVTSITINGVSVNAGSPNLISFQIGYCGSLSQLGVNIDFVSSTSGPIPNVYLYDPLIPSSYNQAPGANATGDSIDGVMADDGYPWDDVPDCSSGYIIDRACPANSISFHWFESQLTITGLTTGSQYCIQFVFEYSTDGGSTWSTLETLCVSFVATAAIETTDWYAIAGFDVVKVNPGGTTFYRLAAGSPTCVADPGGSICTGCPPPLDDGP